MVLREYEGKIPTMAYIGTKIILHPYNDLILHRHIGIILRILRLGIGTGIYHVVIQLLYIISV